MKSPTIYIGISLFIGWVLAILVNFTIYEHTTEQATWIHPVLDAILFMAAMLVIFIITVLLHRKSEKYSFILLSILGALSLVFIILY